MQANDTYLASCSSFQAITGPNMSGKTTYLRQVALIVIMAHIGCFVPASFASVRIVDRLLTRMGTSDMIECNCSSFLVEMQVIFVPCCMHPAALPAQPDAVRPGHCQAMQPTGPTVCALSLHHGRSGHCYTHACTQDVDSPALMWTCGLAAVMSGALIWHVAVHVQAVLHA